MEQKARIFDGYQKQYLVLFGLLVFSAALFVSAAEEMGGKNIVDDPDQDGLTTEEERVYGTDSMNSDTDGDGYTDGVEISGGYDPLKKAPGDKIVPEDPSTAMSNFGVGGENLTEKMAEEIATIVRNQQESGSDSSSTEISLEELSAVTQDIVSGDTNDVVLPEVDLSQIKIKEQSYKGLSKEKKKEKIQEDILEYLTVVSYVFANNSPKKFDTTEDFESLSDSLVDQVILGLSSGDFSQLNEFSNDGEKMLEQIYDVEVPEQMLDVHVKAIKLAMYAASLKGELEVDPNEDPMKMMQALSKAQGLINVTKNFVMEAQEKLSEYDIESIPLDL